MKTDVLLPQLGNEITEAEVTEWLKAVGDSVKAGEQLVLVTTPKVTLEIEAPVDGILIEQRFEELDLANVGDVLAVIESAE